MAVAESAVCENAGVNCGVQYLLFSIYCSVSTVQYLLFSIYCSVIDQTRLALVKKISRLPSCGFGYYLEKKEENKMFR